MTTQRDKLREDVQFRILRLLQDNPEMSQRELAKAVCVSTGGIHYVLNALLDKGLLKMENVHRSQRQAALCLRAHAQGHGRKGRSDHAVSNAEDG